MLERLDSIAAPVSVCNEATRGPFTRASPRSLKRLQFIGSGLAGGQVVRSSGATVAIAVMVSSCAWACLDRKLVAAVEARARVDLDCPDGDVNAIARRHVGSEPVPWPTGGCGKVARYVCRRKAGFDPVSLGGPVVVDNGEYVCVRLWIDEVGE
jgi:hypothetical protein